MAWLVFLVGLAREPKPRDERRLFDDESL